MAGAVIALTGLIKLIDYLHVTTEEALESLAESVEKFDEATKGVKELESQIKTCTERLEELQKLADNGTISIADEKELELLKEQNEELERNLALRQAEQIAAQQKVLSDTKDTANKKVKTHFQLLMSPQERVLPYEELLRGVNSYMYAHDWLNSDKNKNLSDYKARSSAYNEVLQNSSDRIQEMYNVIAPTIDAYDALVKAGYVLEGQDKTRYEQLKKAQDAYLLYTYHLNGTKEAFRGLNTEQQKNIILNKLLAQGLSDAQAQSVLDNVSTDKYDDLWDKDFNFTPPAITDYDTAEAYGKAYAEAWLGGASNTTEDFDIKISLASVLKDSKEDIENFTSSVESAYEAYAKLMSPNVSSSDILSSIMSITEAVSAMGGSLNWGMVEGNSNPLELLGDAIEYISEKYAKSILSDAGIDADSGFGKMLANNIVQAKRASIQLDNLNTQIDSLQNAYDNLTDIVETYNETGYITLDQLQILLELEPQYLACLIDESGQLQLNNEAMSLLAQQRLNDAEAQAIQQAISELGQLALQDEKTAVEENAEAFSDAITDLSNYNTELANTIAETSVAAAAIRDLNAAISGAESDGATDSQIDTVLSNLETKLQLINSVRDKVASGGIKQVVKTSSSSSSDKKDFKETFDWVETAISRIQRTITNLGKVVSATYKKWGTRNNALAQEMSAVNQEIAAQQSAYDAYMHKANSIALPEHYKNLIQNGGMSISDITDEKLAENIKLYQEYYEKALGAADAVEDLRANLAELAMTNFDHISKQYDDMISLIEHRTSMLDGYISQSEAAGFWASEVYYQKLADTELENINQLQSQYNDLIAQFNENVNNGYIEKYSEAWYEMYQNINDVEQAIQDANTSLIEYNQTLQQIRWDLFDRGMDYKNNLVNESKFLIDMLDNYALHNDDGSFTDHGLSVQGLHAVNYNVYMEQAASYADEIQKINEEIANDPNDLQLIDRRNELLDLQQQAIQNAMAEKEAIKDLVSDSYDKMLSSLQELIDKRKEALNAEKDLYDYQNSIKEKTDTISNYRKQLQSYAGDNSEEAKATIQKLQVSLADAEKDLQETEYDKWLSDQESLLDDLYDQTEVWINGRLDNIDGLVYQSIEATNANTSTISQTINDTATALGYTLSTSMESIWNSDEGGFNKINNAVKAYGDILYGTQNTINTSISNCTTTVQTALKSIDDDILKMIDILNAEAKINAESIAQQQQQAESSQDNHESYDSSPEPEPAPAPAPNKVTLNGGLFYEDSYKGGHTGNNSSQWTDHEVEITHTSSTGMVHIVDKNTGTILGWVDPKQLNGYATGTTNAKRGLNLISENGDEIVIDNNGNAVLAKGKQIYPFEGGETVIKANETADILKNNLVPLNESALLGSMTKKSNYSSLQGMKRSSGHISNDIKMNITLPNVTDYDSFVTQLKSDKRFEKIVQSMTVDQVLNKNSLLKNKL